MPSGYGRCGYEGRPVPRSDVRHDGIDRHARAAAAQLDPETGADPSRTRLTPNHNQSGVASAAIYTGHDPISRSVLVRYVFAMRAWIAISRLLMVLSVVGLVAGAFASTGKASAMDEMTASGVSMTAMPCCDAPQDIPDCQDMTACPVAVVCGLKCPQPMASATVAPPRVSTVAGHFWGDDWVGDSVATRPPGRPPKA